MRRYNLLRTGVALVVLVTLIALIHRLNKYVEINRPRYDVYMKLAEDDLVAYQDHRLNVIMKERAPRRFALISTSLVNETAFYYMLFIPFACLAWRRLGYEPLILLIKNNQTKSDQLSATTLRCLSEFNVQVLDVDTPVDYERITSMMARLFVGILPSHVVHDHDFVFLSDSDLMPINKEYFNLINTDAITVLNAFKIGKVNRTSPHREYDMFPMAYIGMRKWQWRQVMGLKNESKLNGETIINRIKSFYNVSGVKKNQEFIRGDRTWFTDQNTITIAINEYLEKNANATINKYHYRGLRLDRADDQQTWYTNLNHHFDLVLDAHLFHGDAGEKKQWYVDLLTKVFSPDINRVLIEYTNTFLSLVPTNKTELS